MAWLSYMAYSVAVLLVVGFILFYILWPQASEYASPYYAAIPIVVLFFVFVGLGMKLNDEKPKGS